MQFSRYLMYVENIGSRYFMIAGTAFLIFYFFLRKAPWVKKIRPGFPEIKDCSREIVYSTSTILIFAFVPLLELHYSLINRYTLSYKNIVDDGWFYLGTIRSDYDRRFDEVISKENKILISSFST